MAGDITDFSDIGSDELFETLGTDEEELSPSTVGEEDLPTSPERDVDKAGYTFSDDETGDRPELPSVGKVDLNNRKDTDAISAKDIFGAGKSVLHDVLDIIKASVEPRRPDATRPRVPPPIAQPTPAPIAQPAAPAPDTQILDTIDEIPVQVPTGRKPAQPSSRPLTVLEKVQAALAAKKAEASE